MMKQRVYWRFVIPTAILAILMLLVLSTSTLIITSRHLQNEKERSLRNNAQVVSGMATKYMENPVSMVFKIFTENLVNIANTNGTSMLFCDMDGNILFVVDADSYKTPSGKLAPALIEEAKKPTGAFIKNSFDGYYNKSVYTYGTTILGSSGQPFATLFVSGATGVLDRVNENLFLALWIGVVALIVVSIVIALSFGRRLTHPITVVREAADAFAKGDFSVRIKGRFVNEDNEFGQLARTFNDMAQSIQLQDRARYDFIANITHELRSPMTTIGGFVGGMLDGTIPPERQEYYLGIILEEVQRLSRLVSSTLYLSRMQDSATELAPVKLNLCETVNKVLFGFEQKIIEKEFKMDVEYVRDSLFILADADAFTQVIYNLVDNAVKYTPPGGRISIRCFSAAEYAFFTIENTGTGIAQDQIPFVFDRYYKSDTSRGLAKESSGLGLSIVKSIVDKHNARITLESVEQEFTRFTIQIKLLTRE